MKEISPTAFANGIKAGADPVVLDVREPAELEQAKLPCPFVNLPMSRLIKEREAAVMATLPDLAKPVVVVCHHGVRSADVAGWLEQLGYQDVATMTGGLARYADEVDGSIGAY